MTQNTLPTQDWDPKSAAVLRDQRAAFDVMRERGAVAYSDALGWSVFRHAEVLSLLNDHTTFSSRVSEHLSVPNGMDLPEHTEYRRIIEGYFRQEDLETFEPHCRKIASDLAQSLRECEQVELISVFAQAFAVRVQCAFLGWPASMYEPLRLWSQKNHQATLAQDHPAMLLIAREFAEYVDTELNSRRAAGSQAPDDIMTSLLGQRVYGRPLRDEEIVSILRNWTVGEVGTITAAVGILAQYLSEHLDLQQQLRAEPALLPAAIDEILRLHGPLVANRRITTCPVQIGERMLPAGAPVSINWIAANRDGRAFEDPQAFRLDRPASANLLYGAGIHVCPGAFLARMEMRVAMQALLAGTLKFEPNPDQPATLAVYPASGFASLPLHIQTVR